MSRFTLAALVAAALSMSACGSTPPTAPTPIPPAAVTDTFSGTLSTNGATSFPFSVSSSGAVYLTLTSVADTSVVVGMSLGTWSVTGICSAVLSNDAAVQGASIAGSATNIGTLCARVYDVGKVVSPLDYQISVVHF